jgi:3-isopropylmalate/(R)-2-methylmalate dehydratase small subunit
VIAASFSRIFYRNALNNGLLAIVCPAAAEAIQPGERVTVDAARCTVTCAAGEFPFPPLSPSVLGIVEAGGLVEYVKRRLAGEAHTEAGAA